MLFLLKWPYLPILQFFEFLFASNFVVNDIKQKHFTCVP